MTRPHVLASLATSLDGFLDDASDARRILSGPADLDRVDAERAGVDAILVGAGTVRADDPRLLVRSADRRGARVAGGRPPSPLRVVLTRSGDLDPRSAVFTTPGADVLVYAPTDVAPALADRLAPGDRDGRNPSLHAPEGSPRAGGTGAGTVTVVPSSLEPADVLADLAGRGVRRLMVEGGATVLRAFLDAGLVDELQRVIAPVFVGGVDGEGGPRFAGAGTAHLVEARAVGPDVLLRHRLGPRDDRWLAEACTLAERCPPAERAFAVGCVVVAADDTVLATGWSRRDDPLDHAEEAALRGVDPADPRLPGATVYSSLEPCGQRASRPVTCADHVLAAGVRRVVIAWREPPVFVGAPSGARRLEQAGVEVVELARWAELARRPQRNKLIAFQDR